MPVFSYMELVKHCAHQPAAKTLKSHDNNSQLVENRRDCKNANTGGT
jgi:hypothetical protein